MKNYVYLLKRFGLLRMAAIEIPLMSANGIIKTLFVLRSKTKNKMVKLALYKILDKIGLLELNSIVFEYLEAKSKQVEKYGIKNKDTFAKNINLAVMYEDISEEYFELNKKIIKAGYKL